MRRPVMHQIGEHAKVPDVAPKANIGTLGRRVESAEPGRPIALDTVEIIITNRDRLANGPNRVLELGPGLSIGHRCRRDRFGLLKRSH